MSSVVSSAKAKKFGKIGIAKANTAQTSSFDISEDIANDQAKFSSLNTSLGITYSGNAVSGNTTTDRIADLENDSHTHNNKVILDATTASYTTEEKNTIATVNQAGTTASRPSGAATGQQYFDTDLGIPIWYNGTSWVNSNGTIV